MIDCNPDSGLAVHYPDNPDKFEFDKDVASIFPDMAVRAIPGYALLNYLHAQVAATHLIAASEHRKPLIVDVGASVGTFLYTVAGNINGSCSRLQDAAKVADFAAIDTSKPMCDELMARFPWMEVYDIDITEFGWPTFGRKADIIVMHYVLQFIPYNLQPLFVSRCLQQLRPGGILLFSAKLNIDDIYWRLRVHTRQAYYNFRLDKKYTPEEIAAKTRALKGSMFCRKEDEHIWLFRENGMQHIQNSFRWGEFAGFICTKEIDNVH